MESELSEMWSVYGSHDSLGNQERVDRLLCVSQLRGGNAWRVWSQ